MKREYEIPEITLIDFTAKDMLTESLLQPDQTADPSGDSEIPASIFGW